MKNTVIFYNIIGRINEKRVIDLENESRTLSELQKELDRYINQFKIGYFSPLSQMIQLSEEVGELAREINHQYGEKSKKKCESVGSIKEELGDVLITTLIMANALDIDLDQVMEENMKKFKERDYYRFERKDGETND